MLMLRRDVLKVVGAGALLPDLLAGTRNAWGAEGGIRPRGSAL